jgi:hypothetical protein
MVSCNSAALARFFTDRPVLGVDFQARLPDFHG